MVEKLAEYHAEEARPNEVVGFYGELLDKDPLRQDVHSQVRHCLAQSGDRARAMKRFERL